jgi:hypothetical protein
LDKKDDEKERLESALPKFVPDGNLTAAQLILKFDYPNQYKDALIGTLDGFKGRDKKPGDTLVLRFTKKKYVFLEARKDLLLLKFHKEVPTEIRKTIIDIMGIDEGEGILFSREFGKRGAIERLVETQREVSRLEAKIDEAIEKAVVHMKKPIGKVKRAKWDKNKFFEKVGNDRRLKVVKFLHRFAKQNGEIAWGSGVESGSFTMKVGYEKAKKGKISLFTIWTNGNIVFRFGNIAGRAGYDEAELLYSKLARLPGLDFQDKSSVMKSYGSRHSLEEVFSDKRVLKEFAGSIMDFLKNLKET